MCLCASITWMNLFQKSIQYNKNISEWNETICMVENSTISIQILSKLYIIVQSEKFRGNYLLISLYE